MTKKDHIKIADALAKVSNDISLFVQPVLKPGTVVELVVSQIGTVLSKDNSKFDYDRWYDYIRTGGKDGNKARNS